MSRSTPVCTCIADEEGLSALHSRGQDIAIALMTNMTQMGMCDLAQREMLVVLFVVWTRNVCMTEDPTEVMEGLIRMVRDEFSEYLEKAQLARMDDQGQLVPVEKKEMN